MSRKHRTGQSGKGHPTPRRAGQTGVKSRPTPTRSTRSTSPRGPVYRQRRFPPLPLAWKLVLAALWVAALVLVLLFVDSGYGQVVIMIGVTFALPIAVVLLRDPSRSRR